MSINIRIYMENSHLGINVMRRNLKATKVIITKLIGMNKTTT